MQKVSYWVVSKDLDGTGSQSALIGSNAQFDLASWNEVLQHATTLQMPSHSPSVGFREPSIEKCDSNFQVFIDGELSSDNIDFKPDAYSALIKSTVKIPDDDTDSAVTTSLGIENDASIDGSYKHSSPLHVCVAKARSRMGFDASVVLEAIVESSIQECDGLQGFIFCIVNILHTKTSMKCFLLM